MVHLVWYPVFPDAGRFPAPTHGGMVVGVSKREKPRLARHLRFSSPHSYSNPITRS